MYSWQHRALLHNTWGIELCTKLFGDFITDSEGREVLVRDIAVEHIREDCDGRVPLLSDWMHNLEGYPKAALQFNKDFDISAELGPETTSTITDLLVHSNGYWWPIINTDFFLYLLSRFCSFDEIEKASKCLRQGKISTVLRNLKRNEPWLNKPQKKEIEWLKRNKFL